MVIEIKNEIGALFALVQLEKEQVNFMAKTKISQNVKR